MDLSLLPSPTRRFRIAMGTWIAIEASAGTAAGEQAAVNAAYDAISAVERLMHPHREGSDLARINSAPPGAPIELHADTWQVLQLATTLHDLTAGVFDPCLPNRQGTLADIELRNDSKPVLICKTPVTIDLGGIAKGFAIDRAIETLSQHGCQSGLVNAGGDLRVFGAPAHTILIRDNTNKTYRPTAVRNAALAVSDVDATEPPIEHQGYYNRTGEPTPLPRRYAAVVAKTAAVADALTKCVLLCREPAATRALQALEAQSLTFP